MDNEGVLPLQISEKEVSDKLVKVQEWIQNRDSTKLNFSYSFLTKNFQMLPIYGKRLVYRLMEYAYDQRALVGQTLDQDFEIGKWSDNEITLNVRDLLASKADTSFKEVKEYIKGLMENVTEETNSKGDVRLSHFIQDCDLTQSGKIVLRVNRRAWEALLDFTEGFERGELEVLFQCEGEYTPLAYLLFACQKSGSTIEYSVEKLRAIFTTNDKSPKQLYQKNWDFVKNVIEPPMKELEQFSPVSYTFTTNLDPNYEGVTSKSGKRGRPSLEKLQFHPKRIIKNEPTLSLKHQVSPSFQLNARTLEVLKNKLGFSSKELDVHIDLLTNVEKLDLNGFLDFLDRNVPAFVRAANPKAYTIGSIKNYYNNLSAKKQRETETAQIKQQSRGGEAKEIGDILKNL